MQREMHTKIVGTTMGEDENRQATISTLAESQKIFAKREEDNPFDSNAIKLYADEAHTKPLGYLGKDLAKDIVEQGKQGWTYNYVVWKVTGGGHGKSYGCNITIIANKGE